MSLSDLDSEVRTAVALGHLRLSIVDLSEHGRQPFLDGGGRALSFNGEIYNYIELRRELERLGHEFRTSTDTEVVLQAWGAWGLSMFERFNGMWALALWDAPTRTLVLSRDRLGEKPLFFTDWRDGIAFASEVKQLAGFPEMKLRPDEEHIGRFIATGLPYHGWSSSFFEAVRQVEPGTVLSIGETTRATHRYYDLEASAHERVDWSAADLNESAHEAFMHSVKLRLRADVDVGVCLSSGVDSTAIVRAMKHHDPFSSPHAFTFDASIPKADECTVARRTAANVGAQWIHVEGSRPDFGRVMPALVWHHETPIPESSIYAQWCLYRAARKKHIKVLLDGQGADELFGGYLKFLAARARFDSRHDPFAGLLATYGLIRQLLALPASLSSVRRFVRPRGHRANAVAGMVPKAPPLVRERDMRIADLITWSLPNLLSWQDRSSMAHGVEARLPFLDPNLLAIGLSAPSKLLYHHGRTKYPIRMIAARLGEPEVAWRWGKIPFASEEKAWMRARALHDNGTRSSLWSTFETGGAADELRRLADAGEHRALVRRLAIDEFLRTFWPDAVDGRSSSATGVSETVR